MRAPERLGKYLIRRELGRGAMGVVYEGYDPMIERAVAIKVLRLDEADPHLAAELRMRFRREAQAAGRLGHPGIVGVYEYGEDIDADATFIAMELVRGRDLKSLFDSGKRFTLAETGGLMAELLAALHHAHERGVVHRDVKPGNIILLDDGGVKVADFGIARLDTSELTQLGSVLGTVSHMSPEQLTGEAVDGRSDLYSCGVILYQLLTGERPFRGPPAALIHKVLHETPAPVSQRVPGLTPALDAVVQTAMAKQAAQRYPDARAFAAALRTALAALPPALDADATVVLPAADTDATVAPARRVALDATVPSPTRVTADPTVALSAPQEPRQRGGRGVAVVVLGGAAVVVAGVVAFRMLGTGPGGDAIVAAPASAVPVSASAAASGNFAAATPSSGATAVYAPPASTGIATSPASKRIDTAHAVAAASTPRLRPPMPAPTVIAAAPPPSPKLAPLLDERSPGESRSSPPSRAGVGEPRAGAASPAPAPPTRVEARVAPAASASPAHVEARGAPASAPPVRVALAASTPPARVAPRVGAAASASPPAASASSRGASAAGSGRADVECLEEARRGNARCQVVVGTLYRSGRGVPRDPAEAARWYRKAAEQGSDAGQYELGLLHEAGLGVPLDPVAAVAWYRKAAAQGHARAQNKVGSAFENGTVGAANPVLAAEWYGKAADQNLPIAEYNLGRLYLSGRGVFKDKAKAQALLQKAADAGEPNAMVYVAAMYEKGDGKARDRDQAMRLYRDALARPGINERNRDTATRALATAR